MQYSIYVTRRQAQKAPLIFRAMGVDHEQEPINRPGGFPTWQIFYGVSGSGEFVWEDGRGVLREGQIALLSPGGAHRYESLGGSWVIHYVCFDEELSMKLLSCLGLSQSGIYSLGKRESFLDHLEALRKLALSDGPERCLQGSKEIYSFLTDLGTQLSRLPAGESAEGAGTVREVVLFLEEHYARDLSLEEIAEPFGWTPEYLCSRFREETGGTVMQYLRRVRIHRAKIRLMEDPEASLRQIAEECGFHSPSYFGKVFRESVGCTPQAYRMGRTTERREGIH